MIHYNEWNTDDISGWITYLSDISLGGLKLAIRVYLLDDPNEIYLIFVDENNFEDERILSDKEHEEYTHKNTQYFMLQLLFEKGLDSD